MSCVSLSSSSASHGHTYGDSYSSNSSGGFSTAPTSVPGTPGFEAPFLDSVARIRVVNGEFAGQGLATPRSVRIPAEVRPGSKEHFAPFQEVKDVVEDYFSQPLTTLKKRQIVDYWGELPSEIKVQIFGYLRPKEIIRCSAVSKSWHRMCYDGQLWINLDTKEFYRDIPSDSLINIIKAAGPFVRDLNLRGCVQLRERWTLDGPKITEACRNLENFSVEGCRIDRSAVHFFLLRNPRLVHINLSGLSALNNSAMKIIAQNCPQLEHLNVSWCQHIDTKGLHRIVQACPKLKDLRAGEIRGWNDREFLLDLQTRNNLERLILSHCTDFDDTSLELLIQGGSPEIDPLTERAIILPRKFRHLDFSRCRLLTNKGLQHLSHHVPYLSGIQLSQCHSISDDGISSLLTSTPHLTHLDLEELDELTNATLQILAKSPCAPNLEHLSISYCENLGDTGMLPVLKSCPKIRTLDMDNTRISDLVLAEAATLVCVRNRLREVSVPPAAHHKLPKVALRIVAFDCQNVTWTGIREILSRNAEPLPIQIPQNTPRGIIKLKCFYGYQPTVDEHTKRVLRGDMEKARVLERKWAEYMVASEEAGVGGAGARRRRRRAREAAAVHIVEETGEGRRRARSGGAVGCTVM